MGRKAGLCESTVSLICLAMIYSVLLPLFGFITIAVNPLPSLQTFMIKVYVQEKTPHCMWAWYSGFSHPHLLGPWNMFHEDKW